MNKAKILIVEDEAIIGMELQDSIQNLGYEVTAVVNSGEKALQSIEIDRPDLILMDIRIKGEIDGINTAEQIKNRFGIPVVFSTAYLDEGRVERAKITMPFGYVLKPIQQRDLKITLEMALHVEKLEAARRESEEKLRKSEAKLKSIFTVLPAGIGLVRDRVLLEVNSRLCEMLQYQEDELVGKKARILYPSQEVYEFVGTEKYSQIAVSGTGSVETSMRKKDGSIINVLLASTPLDIHDLSKGVTFTVTDITNLKLTEQNLIDHQHRQKQANKLSKIGHWDRFMNTGELLWSDEVYDIFGQDKESFTVTVESFEKTIHPEDLDSFIKERENASAERRDFNIEHRIILPDGSIRWVHEIAEIMRDENGEVTRVMGVVQDITKRKESDESLRHRTTHQSS